MKRLALIFEDIEIRRMPGFPRQGFHLPDLAQGINIVYGPNASGKTTTARAINHLLWPHLSKPEAIALAAHLQLDSARWTIEIEGTQTTVERTGSSEAKLEISPAETRDRYSFALHDLLQAENRHQSFAAIIQSESLGGYDLSAAAHALSFRTTASRPGKVQQQLATASDRLRQARERQARLLGEADRIMGLKQQRERAVQAAAREAVLKLALDAEECRIGAEEAMRKREDFPKNHALMRGDEIEHLRKLKDRYAALENDAAEAHSRKAKAKAALESASIEKFAQISDAISELNQRLRRLELLEQHDGQFTDQLAGLRNRVEEEQRLLGDDVDPVQLNSVGLAGIATAERLAEEAESLRALEKVHAGMESWLGAEDSQITPPIDNLREGAWGLRQWMAEHEFRPVSKHRLRLSWPTLWLGLLAATCSIYLALTGDSIWVLILPVVLGIGAAEWISKSSPHSRRSWEKEFTALGLTPIQNWTGDGIRRALHDLEKLIAQATVNEERKLRYESIRAQRDELEARRSKQSDSKEELLKTIGIDLDLSESKLHWLVKRINAWQSATGAVIEAESRHCEIESQIAECLSLINRLLSELDYPESKDAADAASRITDLERRWETFTREKERLEHAKTDIARIKRDRAQGSRDREAIFERLELERGDEPGLNTLSLNHTAYLEAADKANTTAREARLAAAALREHELFSPELMEMTQPALDHELSEAQALATTRYDLNEAIGNIEGQIRITSDGSDLESALAERDGAIDSLRKQLENDYDAVAGALLLETMQREVAERSRPQVFQEANRVLVDITRGRYLLHVNEGDGAVFHAHDTTTDRILDLDELSSASRIQLFMAVRLGFLSTYEAGPMLPIVFDEILANSDDERAHAMVETAVACARTGRQVFYFTAQRDEVGKWESVLRGTAEITYAFHNLTASTRQPAFSFTGPGRLSDPEARLFSVPPPGDLSHCDYGKRLEIPPVYPWEDVEIVHLWHLIPKTAELYEFLRLGIRCWGQWVALFATGKQVPVSINAQLISRVEGRAKMLGEYIRSWRIGRGRPVDRLALEQSSAVSDLFLDTVAALAQELNGDATKLVDALQAGKVKRFHEKKRNQLVAFLEREGYLSLEPPVSDEQLVTRMIASAASEFAAGYVDESDMKEILAKLP